MERYNGRARIVSPLEVYKNYDQYCLAQKIMEEETKFEELKLEISPFETKYRILLAED